MFLNILLACVLGFFSGRMFFTAEAEKLPLLVVSGLALYILAFFIVRMNMGARAAKVMISVAISVMILTIGVMTISRKITRAYHTDPVFHAKVNAYVLMDPRWQAQLDPQWFEKKRVLIARHTLDIQRTRSVCGDPTQYREIARNYNLAIDEYNRVIAGSMVGSQYAKPVKQLLAPQFNDQLVPCGSVFKPM